jgi:hypothetical protein
LDTLNESENFHSINSYSISGSYKESVEEINSKDGKRRRKIKESDESEDENCRKKRRVRGIKRNKVLEEMEREEKKQRIAVKLKIKKK